MVDRGQPSNPVYKMKALHELSIAVNSSFPFNELAETAVAQMAKSVTPDLVLFYLKENNKLVLKGSYRTPGAYSSISPEIKEVGVCLCGLAASEKKPIYSESINKDPLCTLPECRQAGIQSFAALPLHGVNDTIGVLSIASFTSRDFSAEGAFLETLVSHISVALGNILFREVLERKVEELNKLAIKDLNEQKTLKARLLQAQKMEAIGSLAGRIAHDFNNILTAIIGFGSIVKMKMKSDDPLRVHIEQILESAHRATRLTHSLMPLIKDRSKEEDDLPAKTPQSGTETILVAEDDESLRNLMEIVLKASGFKVIISENGEDAVNKFMENRETIHLCLLDVIMPGKSGIDAYYEIKKARPDIRVIFMSGYTADMMSKNPLPEKDSVHLLKPVEPQALLAKIREQLDK